MKKLLLPLIVTSLYAGIYDVNTKISYDKITLPHDEKMGLLGLNYLVDITPYSFLGAGVYGAVDGKRGGFFTGGIEAGLKYKIDRVETNCGVFVGGGGGGSAPQGGGLMVRAYTGALYDFKSFLAGLSLSKVKFPNGDIDSNQLSAQLKIPYKTLFFTTKPKELNYKAEDFSYSFLLQNYYPKSEKNLDGKPTQDIKVLGIEIDKEIDKNLDGVFQAGGAFDGGADGYAEILFGTKYKIPLTKNLNLDIKALIGASGGGRVDTGGGSIYKIGSDLSYHDERMFIMIGGGYMDSFDGSFHSTYTDISLGYKLSFATPVISEKLSISFSPKEWGISLLEQRYKSNKNMRKTSSKTGDIDLIGIKIDRMITDSLYLSATALGAYRGEAGGYAVGLLGVGYKYKVYKSYLKVELQAGAGGGGSIASGDALITQPEIGFGYEFGKNLSVEADYSKVRAVDGKLDSDVFTLGMRYKLYKLER